ncbi:hypothetical protein [Terasakiella pusilla]|uniref:hypothetical protein n=1 Tax=Terasakiella pusilla TaxID=64973 RepID=UPI003AA85EB1
MNEDAMALSEMQEKLDSDADKTVVNDLMARLGVMDEAAKKQIDGGLKPDDFARMEKFRAAIAAAGETFQSYWVTKNT